MIYLDSEISYVFSVSTTFIVKTNNNKQSRDFSPLNDFLTLVYMHLKCGKRVWNKDTNATRH